MGKTCFIMICLLSQFAFIDRNGVAAVSTDFTWGQRHQPWLSCCVSHTLKKVES